MLNAVFECDGRHTAVVCVNVVNDGCEEALGDCRVNGADVLLVVDVTTFDQLIGHDVVAGFHDEAVARDFGILPPALDLREPGIDLFELFGQICPLHDEVFLRHGVLIIQVEGVQAG